MHVRGHIVKTGWLTKESLMNFGRGVLMDRQKSLPDFSGLTHEKRDRMKSAVCFNLIIKRRKKMQEFVKK